MSLNQRYLSVIRKHYPKIKQTDLQVFADGWDHVVIVAKNTQAFRFPRSQAYTKRLPIEISFLQQLLPISPINIPRLTPHQDPQFSLTYATYPFIQGVKFNKDIQVKFSPPQKNHLAHQLGQFITALHSFSVPKAKKIGLETIRANYWPNRLKKIQATIFPLVSIKEQQWITNLFNDFFTVLDQVKVKFVVSHSDIAPEHIIVDPKTYRLAGLIDFGDISIGDPAYDFQFERAFGSEFLQQVYTAYKLPKDKTFDTRRKFYESSQPVRNLENSINRQDQSPINLHKQQLTDFIKNQLVSGDT